MALRFAPAPMVFILSRQREAQGSRFVTFSRLPQQFAGRVVGLSEIISSIIPALCFGIRTKQRQIPSLPAEAPKTETLRAALLYQGTASGAAERHYGRSPGPSGRGMRGPKQEGFSRGQFFAFVSGHKFHRGSNEAGCHILADVARVGKLVFAFVSGHNPKGC
jgi:hypothetical protein